MDRSLLPQTFDKVIQARRLLSTGKVKQISEAVKKVGISRGSYYKYKDLVYEANQESWNQKAVISFLLLNKRGMLTKVLQIIVNHNASILTINQNIPIHNFASVVISLDIKRMDNSIDDLVKAIDTVDGANKVELISVE